uniref:Palmitoyltransferase n=1 Tax=Panagrolaimus davidi TaxID=227884 RepID=A0A914QDW7_9BILA
MLWSLAMTIFTPVSRIPKEYYVTPEIDQKLKEITPKMGERYLPDSSNAEEVRQQSKILEDFASENGLTFVEMDAHGRLRYCYQCSLIKPDRSHHCSSCGFCVVKFDHHCPWINKCVSYRNYKYFLLYLFYGTSFLVFGFITSLEAIVRFAIDDKPIDKLDEFIPVAVSILIYIGFSYYPLGELLIYHARLVWDNETTCEQAKPPMIR